MNDSIRWDTNEAIRDIKESGICRRTIALVDRTFPTKSNNRSAKLGFGNMTFATAILGFDPVTKVMQSGDGTDSILTRYAFEPDNWILLHHDKGFDRVWAVRISVDKTNKAQDKKNRSTHVIDQGEEQKYGTLADLFWICKTGVETDISVNGAGWSGSSGGGSRDALALSMAKNEGFISDGKKFGQLAHVLCFLDPETVPTPDKPNNPGVPSDGVPGGGINAPVSSSGQVQARPGTVGNSGEVQGPTTVGPASTAIPGTPGGVAPGTLPPPPPPEIPANDPTRTGRF